MSHPIRFAERLRDISPPWLRRTVGGALMLSLGEQLDDLVDRTVDGLTLRFPGQGADEAALALIGADRLFRRGPEEPVANFASRLPRWFDAHRTRGGPFELLLQMRAYFTGLLDVPIDLVYHSGRRY